MLQMCATMPSLGFDVFFVFILEPRPPLSLRARPGTILREGARQNTREDCYGRQGPLESPKLVLVRDSLKGLVLWHIP